jgi:uncharacterized protein YjbI with pentapeptide repeats
MDQISPYSRIFYRLSPLAAVFLLAVACTSSFTEPQATRAVCGPPWTREEVDYSGQDLSAKDFSARHLRNVNFAGAKLRGANFANSCFSGGAKFAEADAEGAKYVNAAFWADFTRANLRHANFNGASLGQSFFDQADLRDSSLAHTTSPTTVFFRDADLRGADFSFSKLLGHFARADLRGANFRNADLTMANFDHANLQGADMRGAIMTDRTLAIAREGNAIVADVKIVPELDAVTCGAGCARPNQTP